MSLVASSAVPTVILKAARADHEHMSIHSCGDKLIDPPRPARHTTKAKERKNLGVNIVCCFEGREKLGDEWKECGKACQRSGALVCRKVGEKKRPGNKQFIVRTA